MKNSARDWKRKTLMEIKVKMIVVDNITEMIARNRENTTGVVRESAATTERHADSKRINWSTEEDS